MPIRTVLRQLIVSIDPGLTVIESSTFDKMESMVQAIPTVGVLFMSMPSEAGDGMERVDRIRSKYPAIRWVVMPSYDYPEYQQLKETRGFDHIISQENLTRQIVERIINRAREGV